MKTLNELFYRIRGGLLIVAILAICVQPLYANNVDSFTEPYRTINVSTAEQGIITKMLVKEGDTVRKGQLLATLDKEVLEAAMQIAKAGKESLGRIKSASAAVELRKDRYDKLVKLEADGHAHPEEVLRAKTELEIAEAELLAAKEEQKIKELEYTRIGAQLERRNIVSPIDGVVTKIHKEVSEQVAATDPIVLTLVQCDRLKIVFPVTTAEVNRFSAGQKVAVNFPGDSAAAKGVVESVSQVTDPESGTVRVRVVLDNEDKRYRSGMACFLNIIPTPQTAAISATDDNSEKDRQLSHK
jgi:RND family efflux transporter MFP subunit